MFNSSAAERQGEWPGVLISNNQFEQTRVLVHSSMHTLSVFPTTPVLLGGMAQSAVGAVQLGEDIGARMVCGAGVAVSAARFHTCVVAHSIIWLLG